LRDARARHRSGNGKETYRETGFLHRISRSQAARSTEDVSRRISDPGRHDPGTCLALEVAEQWWREHQSKGGKSTMGARWRLLMMAAVLAGGLATAGGAMAAPGDGLANSAHDFTLENGVNNTVDVGLCTFCHTPHRAQQTKLLWNHTLSSNTFQWTDTVNTMNGTPLPTFDQSWQGVSKNCLSCHDGTVAIGDVAWFRAASRNGLDAILDHTHDAAADPALITAANPGSGDMDGNHPVAHPFPFQGAVSTYNGVTSGLLVVSSGWQADPQTAGIRLFNDDGSGEVTAGAVVGQTGIECSSCHDPHNGSAVIDDYFLRGTIDGNDANYICLKCHDK
jgi:hypothetical protein